jgi:peroxiredoxin
VSTAALVVLSLAILGCAAPDEQGAPSPKPVRASPAARVAMIPNTSTVAPRQTMTAPVPAAARSASAAPVSGAPAPDFTLTDLQGREVSLASFRGKRVMLNFWATWWPACRGERSALQQAYEQYQGQGVVILSVDIGETSEAVRTFAQKQGLTFLILSDQKSAVARQYLVRSIPTTFFIDPDGVIRVRHSGALKDSLIKTYLDSLSW